VAPWLERASVAVVAGGMTVYEACAIGTPTVALAVVPAQHAAIQALARLDAVCDGGVATSPRAVRHAAWLVTQLLSQPKRSARLAATARSVVDGQGAARVARQLEKLAMSRGSVSDAA
jgi:spore coat polysaccharide biosynthesis predicted glycosyltransferase SpsG